MITIPILVFVLLVILAGLMALIILTIIVGLIMLLLTPTWEPEYNNCPDEVEPNGENEKSDGNEEEC